ncbi:Arylsulfatase [Pontiella sulfatireligans]|uniref:Arylsulfatase n=1 Tax=Pontiella sulfatireligans TaxID=2750658 RepID=A0A6C2UHZ6_9BACT|nr:sulfatase S1_14 [Kiritimatiellales bacterium]VGO18954.1 Arylsulfatase [Pontiella sulfatireligans]
MKSSTIRSWCFALLTILLSSLALPSALAADKPNVLFIFIDDQGYYDLGCYGATEVKTPRIDALAKNGVRFTDYYSAAPICSPSRAGLITGCYPRRTGNEIWVHRPDATEGIPAERLTVAELFKGAGYATACIGKWHLGFKEEFLPLNQGFDHYYGIRHNMDSFEVSHFDDMGGMPFFNDEEVVERGVGPAQLAKKYTDEAISWIEKQAAADKPFFLYLPHTMLHDPLGVSPEFRGSSNWTAHQEYGDAIQEMDYHVGRLMKTLERLKIDKNTIVLYVSDNGRWPGRNDQQPLRGSKLTTYEGGLKVPAIAYGPGLGIRKGFEAGAVCHAMDWYPTLASIAGIPIPEGVILDGRDLSAMLEGKTDDIPAFDKSVSLNAEIPLRRWYELDQEWSGKFTREEYANAFFYHGSHGALAAVRSGKWKLALHPNLVLYDLENDPGETTEVVATWPKAGEKQAKSVAEAWRIKTKLRGMVIEFQREMNKKAAEPRS